jgi:hypothetical protein
MYKPVTSRKPSISLKMQTIRQNQFQVEGQFFWWENELGGMGGDLWVLELFSISLGVVSTWERACVCVRVYTRVSTHKFIELNICDLCTLVYFLT